jgi:hypothetical protein
MGGGISHKRDVLICDCALFRHYNFDLVAGTSLNCQSQSDDRLLSLKDKVLISAI